MKNKGDLISLILIGILCLGSFIADEEFLASLFLSIFLVIGALAAHAYMKDRKADRAYWSNNHDRA